MRVLKRDGYHNLQRPGRKPAGALGATDVELALKQKLLEQKHHGEVRVMLDTIRLSKAPGVAAERKLGKTLVDNPEVPHRMGIRRSARGRRFSRLPRGPTTTQRTSIMATWYEAIAPYPPLKLFPGDIVRYDPDEDVPAVEVYRRLTAEAGHVVWQAIESCAITPVSDGALLKRLADAPAPALPAPADAVSRRQALWLIRGGRPQVIPSAPA